MPLYALDDENKLVSVWDSDSLRRYKCLECQKDLRIRGGGDRRVHFYHLQSRKSCRLHNRSARHIAMQLQLQKKMPEIELEKPFHSILRIADLCWERHKIVFEIQCSPISIKEAYERKRDYALEGYELIWLLDDKRYNKKILRPSEGFLRGQACYFFSSTTGLVYDQFELVVERSRLLKGPPLPIDLLTPTPIFIPPGFQILQQQKSRLAKYIFQGDLLFRSLTNSSYLDKLIAYEETMGTSYRDHKKKFFWFKKIFLIGLESLLRLICRK